MALIRGYTSTENVINSESEIEGERIPSRFARAMIDNLLPKQGSKLKTSTTSSSPPAISSRSHTETQVVEVHKTRAAVWWLQLIERSNRRREDKEALREGRKVVRIANR